MIQPTSQFDNRELARRLNASIAGDVLSDRFSRGRYATDASVYQMMPHAVVQPRHYDDVRACLSIAKDLQLSVLPRGGGTSQCGQTVNHSLVLDNTRYLNQLVELDVENRTCVVEPGIVLDELNRQLAQHGLWYPVDVSTASRATIGGMTANNSCGQRSIYYGIMRDNVIAIDAILASGDELQFAELQKNSVAGQTGLFNDLLTMAADHAVEIQDRFPRVQRRVGGYNLDALVPAAAPVNMAHLLVGSEGTLAYSKNITLKLWPLPVNKVLGVCHFPTFHAAMDAAQHLVALNPCAVELVDNTMISLARDIDIYKPLVEQFVRGDPAAILLVEFAFDDQADNLAGLKKLDECMADLGFTWQGSGDHLGGVVEAVDSSVQAAIAEVRKAGLNIMMSMKSEGKPVSFVEDCAVELKDLADYTAGLTEIFHRHGTEGTWYAHASVGCLHVRPVLNLKLDQDAATMRRIAEEAFDLVLKYKGSHSGEHGDGIARSEFNEKMFGEKLHRVFVAVKQRFDPDNLFNPGKITNAPRMNDRTIMRYAPGYSMKSASNVLDWSGYSGAAGGLQGAIEMCNNNGACRKLNGGVMCPSYRVTRNERDVTRGRANSLRLALSGQLGDAALGSDEMHQTMKYCVSCKACKRECPTGVDMAKMKIEVLAARAAQQGHSWHQRLVAELPRYAPLAARLHGVLNLRNRSKWLALAGEKLTGFSAQRDLPQFTSDWFKTLESQGSGEREVVLLADTFNTWFESANLTAAVKVLLALGYRVHIAKERGVKSSRRLCCGRTYLSVGMVDKARAEAQRMLDALHPYAQRGVPIIGLEPSCLLTLRDEFLSLLPNEQTRVVAGHAYLFEEFLVNVHQADDRPMPELKAPVSKVLLHGHCHQKAHNVMSSVQSALTLIPGLDVGVVDSACCGMAGAFGYHTETQAVSRQMAELNLMPAVRQADADTLIVADGTSCRHQIHSLSDREAVHVASVFAMSLQ